MCPIGPIFALAACNLCLYSHIYTLACLHTSKPYTSHVQAEGYHPATTGLTNKSGSKSLRAHTRTSQMLDYGIHGGDGQDMHDEMGEVGKRKEREFVRNEGHASNNS